MGDRILVVYASEHGATSGVAEALGKQLVSAARRWTSARRKR
jgi:flavodoxin